MMSNPEMEFSFVLNFKGNNCVGERPGVIWNFEESKKISWWNFSIFADITILYFADIWTSFAK